MATRKREPVELNKPFTVFVDRADGSGYAKDYALESAARRKFDIEASITNNDEFGDRRIERVWVKHYAHSDDAGTIIADFTYPRPREKARHFGRALRSSAA